MNSDLLNGLNEHLKLEFRASHEYLAMAIWLAEHDLTYVVVDQPQGLESSVPPLSAVATPRLLIPLLEVHQQEDGSVTIPDALRPYMDGVEVIRRK